MQCETDLAICVYASYRNGELEVASLHEELTMEVFDCFDSRYGVPIG